MLAWNWSLTWAPPLMARTCNWAASSIFFLNKEPLNVLSQWTSCAAILQHPLGIVSYTYGDEKFFDFVFEVDAETDKGQAEWRMLGTKETPVQVEEDTDAALNVVKYADGLT